MHSPPYAASRVPSTFYRPEVDGLRAIAILPVLLFHGGFPLFSGGFVGVDVFFVISGYLITSILLREHETGKFSVLDFYERRMRRILPAMFVVLAASTVAGWLWLLPPDLKNFSESESAVALFASNIFFWRDTNYFDHYADLKPLLHTWSLAVEEQYYLFYPLFLAILLKASRRVQTIVIVGLLVLGLSFAAWAVVRNPTAAFYLLPPRAWELLLGASIALIVTEQWWHDWRMRRLPRLLGDLLAAVGLACIAAAVFVYTRDTPFPGPFALLPAGGAALILLLARSDCGPGRLLCTGPLVKLGLLSYSAYLWHQPLLVFARERSLLVLSPAVRGGLLLLAICLAWLTWRFIETPFRDRKRFTRASIFKQAAIGTSIFAAIGAAGTLARGFPERFNPSVSALATLTANVRERRQHDRCHAHESSAVIPACQRGDITGAPTFALWGDSHAQALVDEFDAAARSGGISFVQYTKDDCPAALELRVRSDGEDLNCSQFNAATLRDITDRKIRTVVLVSRWQWYAGGAGFDNGEGGAGVDTIEATPVEGFPGGSQSRAEAVLQAYDRTLELLLARGLRVVLVYPVPEAGWDVPRLLARRAIESPRDQSALTTRYGLYKVWTADVAKHFDAVNSLSNLLRVRPDRLFCDTYVSGRCTASWKGEPFYSDNNHVFGTGARLIVDATIQQIKNIGSVAAIYPAAPSSVAR